MPPVATTPPSSTPSEDISPAAVIDPSTLDPATVTTMVEVRLGIDDLDRRIVTLLGLSIPLSHPEKSELVEPRPADMLCCR